MKKIRLGLIGFGNIGSGVAKAIKSNRLPLNKKAGCLIELKAVCDKSANVFKGSGLKRSLIKKSPDDILNDPEIDIIIELIGGLHPAKEIIIKALNNKKHVITANKALLCDHKKELFKIAFQNKVNIYFEASVLAGVPIIKVLRESLAGNRIKSIWGIVNGTSNYILSRMDNDGISFKEALKEALEKGFAERKYDLDVEGVDSAHKLAIMSSLAFGQDIRLKDIYLEGISHISLGDISYARELGYTVKLLAIAKNIGDSIEVRVHPTLLPCKHILSKVNDAYNAVYIQSDLAKDLFLYGEGAGKFSTSSGIMADIVDAASDIKSANLRSLDLDSLGKFKRIKKIDELKSFYYIRFMAVDKPGVLAEISGILSRHKISIASVMQKARKKDQGVPIIMLTHQAKEYDLKKALLEINRLSVIRAKSVTIKIEEES